MAEDNILDLIPGYREAVEAESELRDGAFLGVPHEVCGVEIHAMTLRHHLILCQASNALVCGGPVTAGDAALFLWVLSPGFSRNPGERDAFIRRVARLNYEDTVTAIRAYLDDMHADAPPSIARPEGTFIASHWSIAADFIDLFAAEYGWRWGEILDIPFPVIWQLHRRMSSRADPKAVFINRSDKVRGQWLAEQNAKGKTDGQ